MNGEEGYKPSREEIQKADESVDRIQGFLTTERVKFLESSKGLTTDFTSKVHASLADYNHGLEYNILATSNKDKLPHQLGEGGRDIQKAQRLAFEISQKLEELNSLKFGLSE